VSAAPNIPAVSITTARTGAANRADALGMRPMQARAWSRRGEQYLLIKSPPASGKSRALMFIALDKLANQGVRKAIVVVPERSIGGSFANAPLSQFGFFADWSVRPKWNLCNAPGGDDERSARSKVKAVGEFLAGADAVLVCTHATFRFAFDELGVEAFDDCLIAVDEFHHVSVHPDNRLGAQVSALIARGKAQIVAMTGSYFRGDAVAVLAPEDEARFETVVYTYWEQLNGYDHLKALQIGYCFYSGRYLDALAEVLDPDQRTIIHIPNVNSRESLKDKIREAEGVMEILGEWEGVDEATGFQLVRRPDGCLLRVADLVDDADHRDRVLAALKDPRTNAERDHVDIIIALGMAKEGFDWIWCEHALAVGYRASLTEIIQIIGRATRDAPGKEVARFTNLIAEVDASEEAVTEAINDTLKAIAASLLMEQVLAPRFDFTPKDSGPKEGFDYGPEGYQEGKTNAGFNASTGHVHIEVKGLVTPRSDEARRICAQDLNELIAAFVQDKPTLERGLFDRDNTMPEEITQLQMGKIVRDRYPELSAEDQEAVRQHAVAAMVVTQQARALAADAGGDEKLNGNTALIDGVRRYVTDVRELDIDLIDRINPFQSAYAIIAKAMNEKTLRQVSAAVAGKKATIPEDEARALAVRAVQFKRERSRAPDINSADAWEKRMAEGVAALARYAAQKRAAGG
jgi:hypothetical protein